MMNIYFLNEYFKIKKLQKIIINMSGIINLKLKISEAIFHINTNKLKISDNRDEIIKIDFNEVENVEYMQNKLIINFNINEIIVIE